MEFLVIWLGLNGIVVAIARLARRSPIFDAWPAYLFALPLAGHLATTARTLSSAASFSFSLHDSAVLIQQLATIAFFALLVGLFAARRRVSGPYASRTQGVVALVGTFCLNLVGFLPAESSASTTSLLASSAVVVVGTLFAIWSLAILGRCFGLFPEVRGLVLRGPYRLVRHPVYLGEIVAALGVLLTRPHPLTLALLAVFIAFQYWRTVFEERALTTAFPSDYPAYRVRVARLFPVFTPAWRQAVGG
jgi:protein-S-isoprenylcysteine O-methyltransferase Ste14